VTEDVDLLAAHVAGDPDAFSVLVARHKDRLWHVALRTTGDPEEASDALQDALISAFRRADSFRGDSAVTTWLHRIVVNASLDRLRRRAVRPTVPLPDEAAPRIADPTDAVDRREVQMVIQQALAGLPADQREAVLLVDLEGWPVQDAARILGVPEGTVKSRCFRGRAKLAKQLAFLRNPDGPPVVGPPEAHDRGTHGPHDHEGGDR
jgi:RNA polymerase sigma-70 factor (ECF subfamily)